MDIVQKKDVRSFTMLHIDFLDCETLSSNEKILLAILMRYSYYEKNSPSATFPSFAGLAKKTGLAEKVVRTTLQLLEEKQLISKQARYRNGTKARAANFYVIQDTPSIWKSLEISSDDSNLFDDTIKEAIGLLQTAGYKVMETEKNKKHFFDVGASEKNELASSNNVNFTEPKGIRPFTIIYNDLLDFEGLRSKEKLLLILLIRYGSNRKTGAAFPSIRTLARKTGMSERSVQYTLNKLIEKHLLIRQARFSKGRGQISNTYIVYDNPNQWRSKGSIDVQDTQAKMLAMPDAIHVLGYTAKIQEAPSNLPDKKKASLPDVGASEKDESLSLNNVNFINASSMNDDTPSKLKSQAKVLKLHAKEANAEIVFTTKSEQYSMDFLYSHFDYKSVHMITIQRGFSTDIVDSVFSVLYDTLNSSIINIPIGKELKPTVIVISKLLKLDCWDLLYVIEKYNSQVTEIYSPVRWIQTALYFAREENHLKTINQIAYNMSRSDNI